MNRLNVETSKLQPVMAGIAGVIMVPLGLASLFVGLSDGVSIVPVGLGVAMLATFGGIAWLVLRSQRKSVRYFSEEGLERNDGRWLPWADLDRVVDQVRTSPADGKKALWRTEIWFKNGESAWLLPLRVGNRREVTSFVRGLPCEHAEKEV